MEKPSYSQDKAKTYQKKKQRLSLIQLALTPAILAAMVISPLSLQFKSWAQILSGNACLALAAYFLFFVLFSLIIDLPLSFYSGFILEHRYELSNQSLADWLKDFGKKSALSLIFSLLLIEALYLLIWNHASQWWIFAWAGYALVSFGLGKIFPVWIVPLFYRYGTLQQDTLRARLVNLAGRYGLPVENVYTLNLSKTTKKANAAFMGMGKTKRVVLSDTLLENFTEEEIETVVAHEIGHFKNRDIWKQLGFGILTSFAAFWLAYKLLEPSSRIFGLEGAGDMAGMPLLFLIFYVFGLFLMPVQNGFSRYLERLADRFAFIACPNKEVFVACMEKLGRVNLADPAPHPVYEWFFYDHPSIAKRIRLVQGHAR